MELTERDNLEGSAHTPIFNSNILPLSNRSQEKNKKKKKKNVFNLI